MLIDLHVHSHLTKGCDLDPRAVLERAASLGLEGVAFTETNTQDGCDELFDLQPKTPLRIFVGLELVTDRGQYLCFFPRPEEAPEPVQLWGSNREKPWSAAECIPKVLSLGAVVVAARPYDRDFPTPALDQVLSMQGLSAIEGFNARVRQPANDLAVEAAEKLGRRPYTVREWCRSGRINATKRLERRGGAELWSISGTELVRYRNDGLLAPDPSRNAGR